jgi:signal transduction histidine kinase
MARTRRSSELMRTELVICARDRREVPVEIQSKCFEVQSGTPVYHTVLIDLTDQRRLAEERRRAAEERERRHREELAARIESEAKDRFLAVLSHELRTPLTPILLTLESLGEEREGGSPALRRGLTVMERNVDVLTRLIDDLLDVTRIAHGKLGLTKAPVAVHPELHAVVETCQAELEKHGMKLELDLRARDPHVFGDGVRLRQIFWNLLRNAIQHSPPGGRIQIRSEAFGPSSLRVSVSDSGAGIEPEEIERLFEPFQQAKGMRTGSGLGLGLAICKGLVEAHGGGIRASRAGTEPGATFVVELPTCPAPRVQAAPAPTKRSPAPREALRILLVEDHLDTAEAIQIVLKRLGYVVRMAHTLADGIELAREPFDVLISDVQLPDGSGLELMRELRAEHAVKGIAMSGFGTEDDLRRSREAGFHTHLVKPVDVQSVADAIAALPRD